MTRRRSIRSNNVRRALGIFDPYEFAARRVAMLLENGRAVDSRCGKDGTWKHCAATLRKTGGPS